MNKAYLLVICVLAASFTGCLSDENSELEEQQNTEEEIIGPVGTNNNETDDNGVLIREIQNLTDEIEELNDQVNTLQEEIENLSENIDTSTYKPSANSSISFTTLLSSSIVGYNDPVYLKIDLAMLNETTIILSKSLLNPANISVSGVQDNAWYNSAISFYNYHGAVIQFGKVVETYDYCSYHQISYNYDREDTALINTTEGYVYSDKKTEICDDGRESNQITELTYIFELPYQPTSAELRMNWAYTNIEFTKTFH